jgi:hypothetical protein
MWVSLSGKHNLSLNDDKVSRKKDLTWNLSATVETVLIDVVRQEGRQRVEDDRLADIISALSARQERDGFLAAEVSGLYTNPR